MSNEVTLNIEVYDKLVENNRLFNESRDTAFCLYRDSYGRTRIVNPTVMIGLLNTELLNELEIQSDLVKSLTEALDKDKFRTRAHEYSWWHSLYKGGKQTT